MHAVLRGNERDKAVRSHQSDRKVVNFKHVVLESEWYGFTSNLDIGGSCFKAVYDECLDHLRFREHVAGARLEGSTQVVDVEVEVEQS